MKDSISQDFYVYTLAYPESMGGSIFYVGKGSYDPKTGYDRIDCHEHQAKTGIGIDNPGKVAVIREIWSFGKEVVKTKVAYFNNEEDALLYEWGLINMTTYSENLTNIYRGRGYPHKLGLSVRDKSQKYKAFCIQKHQMRSKGVLVIHHKVSDIHSFCASKCIKKDMLLEVLDGKASNVRGYSLMSDCGCGYTTMTTEKRPISNALPAKREMQPLEIKSEEKGERYEHPLVHARLALDLSLWSYAHALDLGHKRFAQIDEWETGKRIPCPRIAAKIAVILGFDSSEEVRHLCKKWQWENCRQLSNP